ncbi:hypothetical protein M902_1824 [Bacteriovorax sp. BAL6_X]|uniref:hypothetical protein n=1 Tax=Bacteriovorax sp. BAL6_X TaxID=1201290 RepID=UPI00038579EE|nr:hypothetical protein [Bacteriovorax sp. BAL6_X]EPZ52214.1 hypothetical protein M902_1824 [Bacteriovorax sp. BAL6_X]
MIKILNWNQNDFEDGWILNCDWSQLKHELSEIKGNFKDKVSISLFLLNKDFNNNWKEKVEVILSEDIFEESLNRYDSSIDVNLFNEECINLASIEKALKKRERNIVIIDNGMNWNSIRESNRTANDDMVISDSAFFLRMKYLIEKKQSTQSTHVFWIRRDWNREYRWKFLRLNEKYRDDVEKIAHSRYLDKEDMSFNPLSTEPEELAIKWGVTHLLNPNEKNLPSDFQFKGDLIGLQLFSALAVHKKSKNEGVFHNGTFNSLLEPHFTVGSLSEVEIRKMTSESYDENIPQFLNVTVNLYQSDEAIFNLINKLEQIRTLIYDKHNKESLVVRTPRHYDEILSLCEGFLKKQTEIGKLTADSYMSNYAGDSNIEANKKKLSAGLYIIKNIHLFDFKL